MGVASDTMATLDRAMWNDYITRMYPREDELVAAYDNPTLKTQRMAATTTAATLAADSANASAARGLGRYGQTAASAETNRASNLSKTTSIIDAQNINRDAMEQRDKQLLSGSISSRGIGQ